jgi:RND family efflux transporter MFP subunit
MKNCIISAVGLALAISVGSAADDGAKTARRWQEAAYRGKQGPVVKALGTVFPDDVIDIGAQVSGTIQKFGVDPNNKNKPVDYGTVVKAGMILAQIDAAAYELEVKHARANFQQAEAKLALAVAKLNLVEIELQRAKKLHAGKVVDALEVDIAMAKVDIAKAGVNIEKAAVVQSEAVLEQAQRNLKYTTIQCPIDGIIIDRRVNVGQAVSTSLNAPSLFIIATDLKKLQVWAAVREADIAEVAKGQPATFAVEAYPKDTFKGKVTQIRLNASANKGDVTYTVVIETDNSDGRLLPYMTAVVTIDVSKKAGKAETPDKKTVALDALPVDGGARFGDWTLWRYDDDDKGIFLINQKTKYCIYLRWVSNGWINFRDAKAEWYVLLLAGNPEKQNRADLPIAKFVDKKVPEFDLSKGNYKIMNWTVEVTDKAMEFHSSDFGAKMTIKSKSAVFVHNDRKIGGKKGGDDK